MDALSVLVASVISAEPAAYCPSNGFWHWKVQSLSSAVLLVLVLGLVNVWPGQERGQNHPG